MAASWVFEIRGGCTERRYDLWEPEVDTEPCPAKVPFHRLFDRSDFAQRAAILTGFLWRQNPVGPLHQLILARESPAFRGQH